MTLNLIRIKGILYRLRLRKTLIKCCEKQNLSVCKFSKVLWRFQISVGDSILVAKKYDIFKSPVYNSNAPHFTEICFGKVSALNVLMLFI